MHFFRVLIFHKGNSLKKPESCFIKNPICMCRSPLTIQTTNIFWYDHNTTRFQPSNFPNTSASAIKVTNHMLIYFCLQPLPLSVATQEMKK